LEVNYGPFDQFLRRSSGYLPNLILDISQIQVPLARRYTRLLSLYLHPPQICRDLTRSMAAFFPLLRTNTALTVLGITFSRDSIDERSLSHMSAGLNSVQCSLLTLAIIFPVVFESCEREVARCIEVIRGPVSQMRALQTLFLRAVGFPALGLLDSLPISLHNVEMYGVLARYASYGQERAYKKRIKYLMMTLPSSLSTIIVYTYGSCRQQNGQYIPEVGVQTFGATSRCIVWKTRKLVVSKLTFTSSEWIDLLRERGLL
jgi:hypothetical protein